MAQSLQTPFAIATGLGLASSSYFFLGNLGLVTCGVIRFTTSPSLRADLNIPPDSAVSLWAAMYEHGAAQFAPASLLSALALYTASVQVLGGGSGSATTTHRLLGTHAHTQLVSRLFLSASLLSLTILPYTLLVMMPNIKPLIATRDRIRAARKRSGSGSGSDAPNAPLTSVLNAQEGEQALGRIGVWKVQNLGRMAIGATVWALAAVATFLA
ncbi:hypothetical protein OC842_003484 [Tilletia horrida]|uniref:DUF1772-domain-containing protein n=1 Tax=Tilletia horrida TaxID=155126 RepID=A0AAN6GB46_9BASI|nr:hypothetical protein OC842_003484 [Tilletia horrida]